MSTIIACNATHRDHRSEGHVERPERLDAILSRLEKNLVRPSTQRIDHEPATEEDLLLVHHAEHVDEVRTMAKGGGGRLDSDTYVTPASFETALDALGCILAVTRTVLEGGAESGFAAVRPPGHHATPSRSMGFCLFSNVAIAARWAERHAGVSRILIVDYDVHHGNGTQNAFYEDRDVAYMSVHQAPFYPGTGGVQERGFGSGEGSTINVPVPSGLGDTAYKHIFSSILRPIALDFAPELILVSAGFDAHWRDPLGGMRLSVAGFATVMKEVVSWARACCDGRLVGVLEGGYDVEALAASAAATVAVLNDPGAEIDDTIGPAPGRDVDADAYLNDVKKYLAP